MSLHPLLLLRIALIQEGKLDYFSVFALVVVMAVLVLAGIWLWLIGLDLVRSHSLASRVGGGLVLAVASAYTLALAGLGYWEMHQVWEWF